MHHSHCLLDHQPDEPTRSLFISPLPLAPSWPDFVFGLLLVSVLATTCVKGSHVRHEPEPLAHLAHRTAASRLGWTRLTKSASNAPLRLHIALARSQGDAHWPDLLLDVASPTSPRYGQHLSRSQVIAMAAPSSQCVALVGEWLASASTPGTYTHLMRFKTHRVFFATSRIRVDRAVHTRLVGHGDWMEATLEVAAARELLQTEFYTWTKEGEVQILLPTLVMFSSSQRSVHLCEYYSIPAALQDCVDLVAGATQFPSRSSRVLRGSSDLHTV